MQILLCPKFLFLELINWHMHALCRKSFYNFCKCSKFCICLNLQFIKKLSQTFALIINDLQLIKSLRIIASNGDADDVLLQIRAKSSCANIFAIFCYALFNRSSGSDLHCESALNQSQKCSEKIEHLIQGCQIFEWMLECCNFFIIEKNKI